MPELLCLIFKLCNLSTSPINYVCINHSLSKKRDIKINTSLNLNFSMCVRARKMTDHQEMPKPVVIRSKDSKAKSSVSEMLVTKFNISPNEQRIFFCRTKWISDGNITPRRSRVLCQYEIAGRLYGSPYVTRFIFITTEGRTNLLLSWLVTVCWSNWHIVRE